MVLKVQAWQQCSLHGSLSYHLGFLLHYNFSNIIPHISNKYDRRQHCLNEEILLKDASIDTHAQHPQKNATFYDPLLAIFMSLKYINSTEIYVP